MADDPDLDRLQKIGIKSEYSEGDRIEMMSADDMIKLEAHLDRKKRKAFRPRRIRIGGC